MQVDTIAIEIVTVTKEDKVAANGNAYERLNIIYKNLTFGGKVDSKPVMPFGSSTAVHKVLRGAQTGQTYTITRTKGDKGYWDWTEAVEGAEVMQKPQAASANSKPAAAGYTRDFETREERQQRQVLIVRQSSLSAAVNTLTAGAKAPPAPEAVLALAEQYNAYVFGNLDVAVAEE